jgi:hypothetical protein
MDRSMRTATAAVGAAVALLAAIASALGVFARGDGTFVAALSARGEPYQMAATGVYVNNARQVVAEGVGWDLFTLVIAVPLLLVAAVLVARGSFRGTLLAAGAFGYFLYAYLEYAVTWAFGPLLPIFIAITAASLVGVILAGRLLATAGVADRFDASYPRRAWPVLGAAMALLLTVLWAGRIATGLGAAVPVLEGETTMTVQVLDLGLVVPLSLLLAVAVWRGSPGAMVAGAAFLVTFVTMSLAIASMLVSAWIVTGELALPPIVTFVVAAGCGLVLARRIDRSIVPAAPGTTAARRKGSSLATEGSSAH